SVLVTRRRAWPEPRVGMLVLAWVLLSVALAGVRDSPEPQLWLAVGAAFAIAALLWWQELDLNRVRAPEEALLFVANPFVLLALVWMADPKLLDRAPALLPALLAAVYLGVGWARRAAPHLVMGFALGGLAVAVRRGGVRGRLDRAATLFRTAHAARRRPRPERVLAGLRGRPRTDRVPARPQRRPLGRACGGRRGGTQDRAVRSLEPGGVVPHRIVLRARPHRPRRGIRVQQKEI